MTAESPIAGLTGDEYTLIRTHPVRGHEFLRQAGVAGEIELDVCLHHHERPDGKGYPEALSDAAISLAAKMGAVCDVYDAITSNRPYKSGWDPAESIAQMAEWTQKGQFDLAAQGCSDRIVGRESNDKWKFKQLDELWAGAQVPQKVGRAG